ncbi:MAG: DUF1285 domain-containing protein [Sphingomonadaceae bacterium]
MPMDAPLDLATMTLTQVAAALAEKKLPPVALWNPAHCGDSHMRIARGGTWFHEGSPIGREAMVRLFATILRRESDGSYVLVTPAEKLSISVEDAPFVAVELKSEGTGRARRLAFRLNVGEVVVAGPGHGLRFAEQGEGPVPYLHVRGGLEARLARSVYYEFVDLALDEGADPPGLWSDGAFLAIAPA